jgi:hypothetical protein
VLRIFDIPSAGFESAKLGSNGKHDNHNTTEDAVLRVRVSCFLQTFIQAVLRYDFLNAMFGLSFVLRNLIYDKVFNARDVSYRDADTYRLGQFRLLSLKSFFSLCF